MNPEDISQNFGESHNCKILILVSHNWKRGDNAWLVLVSCKDLWWS